MTEPTILQIEIAMSSISLFSKFPCWTYDLPYTSQLPWSGCLLSLLYSVQFFCQLDGATVLVLLLLISFPTVRNKITASSLPTPLQCIQNAFYKLLRTCQHWFKGRSGSRNLSETNVAFLFLSTAVYFTKIVILND